MWGILVALIVAGGVALALVTWPKGAPTNTTWFWVRVLLLPSVAGGIAYGFRLLYWEQETDRTEAERDTRNADHDEALRFAREPLSIIDHRYLCAVGSASAIVSRRGALEARKPSNGRSAVRHTALVEIGGIPCDRYRSCFAELLKQLKVALESLPDQAPFGVYLQFPVELNRNEMEDVWHQCWQSAGYESARCELFSMDRGVMDLDTWLDVLGGPSLERIALVVAAQLRETPVENSAEAAVAILLGWAPLVERSGLSSLGMLHRPVEVADDFNKGLSTALMWGGTEASEIADVWQAGIAAADRSALLQASSDLSMAVSESEKFSGIHDIDAAIGDAGVAASWLAIAVAAEHASQTDAPQLVMSRQGTLQFAVIQPTPKLEETRQ
ncbi:hypothetical protein M3I54_16865 [Paraburkholderia sp. CNPSo 3274]|uniref:hypothetical protein n=1 Tax=Paraburkholderia sp. CNPSo 3274 TaxID=2940932 RepID=UPI0020B69A39|nr:hypothetical protein [Paraburkholderia sp. CNPSo 3274]MCP3708645.1 hypothetical protein [Paraburkholderia sp. CNPSo 3274]